MGGVSVSGFAAAGLRFYWLFGVFTGCFCCSLFAFV
jgi:hypothetical protein